MILLGCVWRELYGFVCSTVKTGTHTLSLPTGLVLAVFSPSYQLLSVECIFIHTIFF